MNADGGVEVQFDAVLILGWNGGDWPASWPSCYNPGERHPSVLWLRGKVGPAVSLDTLGVKKTPYPHQESSPVTIPAQPMTQKPTGGLVHESM